MKVSDLKLFSCPECKSTSLSLDSRSVVDNESDIQEGVLTCGKCTSEFLIARGIPRFVPRDNYANSFGFQWNTHARTQLDSFSGLQISRERVFSVTKWAADLAGNRILEAGSGAGRFTEVLLDAGAEVVTFDYSSACEANYENNKRRGKGKLICFQGDIFNIPLAQYSFDKVFCLGVLQHTPDPERAFFSLAKYVRPGGSLAIDVYTKSVGHWLQWKYILRPITTRMDQGRLYRLISQLVPRLVPIAAILHKMLGRFGRRLLPIVQYGHLGLSKDLNVQWSILDTFDMYAPAHDHPQTLSTVRRWFDEAGFVNVDVRYGPNGVVGVGARPNSQI
jgi:SAM-dependent methyltransferase